VKHENTLADPLRFGISSRYQRFVILPAVEDPTDKHLIVVKGEGAAQRGQPRWRWESARFSPGLQ
jgi:hypothetical protein